MLRRFLKYGEKVYQLGQLVSIVTDARKRPSIETSTIFCSAFIMMAAQLGSLNALEQERENSFWRKWLGMDLPSADTMGRSFSEINLDSIRSSIHHVYTRLKRNKALEKKRGFNVLILDGHEHTSSYLRCCSSCLRRRVHTREGHRIQYYHRNVVAMLSGEDFPVLLDVEEQRRGEDEVSCAMRLSKRILRDYPSAFSVVVADGLYLEAPFFNLFLKHGKHIIAVLKDERRNLMEDAKGLFPYEKSWVEIDGNTKRELWDIEGFTSWASLAREVRVVRSLETKTVCRQRTGKDEKEDSEWIWATTLFQDEASTGAVVKIGHSRWLVENRALNEMITFWHADHVYHHHPTAMVAFWLTLMLVLNLFRAFVYLNIKPELRSKHSNLYFARLIFAGLYEGTSHKIPP